MSSSGASPSAREASASRAPRRLAAGGGPRRLRSRQPWPGGPRAPGTALRCTARAHDRAGARWRRTIAAVAMDGADGKRDRSGERERSAAEGQPPDGDPREQPYGGDDRGHRSREPQHRQRAPARSHRVQCLTHRSRFFGRHVFRSCQRHVSTFQLCVRTTTPSRPSPDQAFRREPDEHHHQPIPPERLVAFPVALRRLRHGRSRRRCARAPPRRMRPASDAPGRPHVDRR